MVRHRKAVIGEIAKLTAADETLATGSLRLQSMPVTRPTIAAVIQARRPEPGQPNRASWTAANWPTWWALLPTPPSPASNAANAGSGADAPT